MGTVHVSVRWHDGYLEEFEASEVRFGSDLLWMKLSNGDRRCIPTRSVRWFDPGENHAKHVQDEGPDMHEGLAAFLDQMFSEERMAPEEKEHCLNMTVRDFCHQCVSVGIAEPEQEPKMTRAEFVNNMHKIPCGICHSSNALTLVDGVITCRVCGATLGDIDDHPVF